MNHVQLMNKPILQSLLFQLFQESTGYCNICFILYMDSRGYYKRDINVKFKHKYFRLEV